MGEIEGSGGEMVSALDTLWAGIRRRHPDVPPVVIIVGRSAAAKRGHFSARQWESVADGSAIAEMFLSISRLRSGAHAVLATALHEAAHGLAAARGVQDTSRQGRYHNRQFAKLAGEMALEVQRDGARGWAKTTLGPKAAQEYEHELSLLELAIRVQGRERPEGIPRSPGQRAYQCQCDPPRRIRATPSVVDKGGISCQVCGAQFA